MRSMGCVLSVVALLSPAATQVAAGGLAVQPTSLLRALPRVEVPFMFAIGLNSDRDGARAFGAADVDRDGDVDLLIGNFVGRTVRLLRNDGDGRFTEATATHMPNITNAGVFQFDMVDLRRRRPGLHRRQLRVGARPRR